MLVRAAALIRSTQLAQAPARRLWTRSAAQRPTQVLRALQALSWRRCRARSSEPRLRPAYRHVRLHAFRRPARLRFVMFAHHRVELWEDRCDGGETDFARLRSGAAILSRRDEICGRCSSVIFHPLRRAYDRSFYMAQKQAQRVPPGLADNQLPTGDDEIGKLTLGFEANSPGGKRNGHPISPSSATLTDRQKL